MVWIRSFAPRAIALAVLTGWGLVGCRACRSAQGWTDRRVAGPFVCRADFSLHAVEGLLRDLAGLQDDLVRLLGVPPAEQWIEVYLFHDQSTYRQYLRRHFPDVPYRRALYVKSRGPGVVLAYRSQALEVDLRHECTHALLHAVLPMVPLWLDEGLAEYFEVSPSQRAFENGYLSGVRWKARLGMVPRMESLEKKGAVDEMGAAEYRNAWAWVHFMVHGPAEAHDELGRFLADIQAGTPPGLLSYRLRQRIPNIEQRFGAHFRSWKR